MAEYINKPKVGDVVTLTDMYGGLYGGVIRSVNEDDTYTVLTDNWCKTWTIEHIELTGEHFSNIYALLKVLDR